MRLIGPHVVGVRNGLILAAFAVFGALATGSSIGCDSAQEDPGGTNIANDLNVQQDADTCKSCIGDKTCLLRQKNAAAVSADLKIVDAKIRGQIRFEVPFDHFPDFLTVDQTGRTEDSFQYYIAYDPTQRADSGTVEGAIVRGDEIHVATALRIRNALPASTAQPMADGEP